MASAMLIYFTKQAGVRNDAPEAAFLKAETIAAFEEECHDNSRCFQIRSGHCRLC